MAIEFGVPVSAERIADAERRLGVALPDELRAFYARSDGAYDTLGYWNVIWELERLVEDTLQAWAGNPLVLRRDLVAFGDDGTGDPYCLSLDAPAPRPVERWSWIDGGVQSSHGTLEEFVAGLTAESSD